MRILRKSIDSLELQQMSFAYENAPSVFDTISIEMPKSPAVWIRSPGGRGKSTLLKILCGLLTPQQGRYLINGQDVNEMSFEEFLTFRLNMGYGFDMGGLLNNKTVAENLLLPLQYHKFVSEDEAQARVAQITDMFAMDPVRTLRPFAIPGSQRKLTCVLRAMIHNPEIVFLDDPMTGLKQDDISTLFDWMDDGFAKRGMKQVFFTSERPDFAEHFKASELLIAEDWFTVRAVA